MSEPATLNISRFGSIRSRLVIAFIVIALLPMMVIGVVLGVSGSQGIQPQLARQLKAAANFKVSALNAMVANLKIALADGLIGENTLQYVSAVVKSSVRTQDYEDARNILAGRFNQLMANTHGFEALFLLDIDGRVVLSTEASPEGKVCRDLSFFRRSLDGPVATLLSQGGTTMLIARPVTGLGGRVIAIIAGRAALHPLNEIMFDKTELGKTGRTYLVNEDRVLMTALPGFKPGMQVWSAGIGAILENRAEGMGAYNDFRGVLVNGVYRWLPELDAALLAEQEQAESSETMHALLAVNAGVALAAILIAAMASLSFTHRITTPLVDLAETATLIGAGQLELTAQVERNDEIGVLAGSFNFMTARLKATMEGLRSSEEKYRRIFENALEGVFRISFDGTLLSANPALARILGYDSPDELMRSMTNLRQQLFVDPAKLDSFSAAVLGQGMALNRELEFYRKDGHKTWVSVSARIERDEAGNPLFFEGFIADINERRRAREELLRAHRRIVSTLESITDGFVALDRHWRFAYVNAEAERILGVQREDLLDRAHQEAFPFSLGNDIERLCRRVADARVAAELEHHHTLDDRWAGKWIYFKAYPAEDGGLSVYFRDITEEKKADEALRESERKFRAIFEQTFQLMGLLTLDGVLIEANQTALNFSGLEGPQVIGKPFWDTPWWTHSPELQKILRSGVQQARAGEFVRFEASHPAADGTMRDIDFSINPVADPNGQVIFLIAEGRDITERKQAENALRDSETLLSVIIDFLPDATFAIDTAGKVLTWNRAIEHMTGVGAEKMRGKGNYEYSLPFYGERRKLLIDLVFESDEVIEKKYHFVKKEGGIITAEAVVPVRETNRDLFGIASPLYDSSGKVVGAIQSIRDITDRVRAESEERAYAEELHAINRIALACTSSPELQSVLERALDETLNIVGLEGGVICLARPDRTLHPVAIRGLDKSLVPLLFPQGIDSEDCFCGKCVIDNRPVTIADCGQPALADRKLQFANIRFLAAFPLTVQSHCMGMLSLFSHEGYEISGRGWNLLQIISAEIALGMRNALLYNEVQQHAETLEQKVRERTIQLEVANKELESFSYSVSHDLRSPLRGIDGWSLALVEDCFDQVNEQGKKHLQRIRSETQRMGKLIDGLLELSRVSRSEMKRELVDLSGTARIIADHLRESEPGRRVEFIIQPGMTAEGDPRLLEILLTNLLGNSWKFTARHDSAVIEFGRMEKNGRNFWFVRDDGAGFAMQYANKLFGPFQRMHKSTEFPGSGIGLATVQRIINRHGGLVWAEAEVEKGATFYFEL